MQTTLSMNHLLLKLRPINRSLRTAASRQAEAAAQLDRPDLAALCVTDQHVAILLDGIDRILDDRNPAIDPGALTEDEQAAESRLRMLASESNGTLPLDALDQRLDLTAFETETLLVCAAAELDHAYERIFAYLMDDLNRRYPCVELLSGLTACNTMERLHRRRLLSPVGRLRRCGLLERFGESTTELHTQLRLGPGVLDFLIGNCTQAVGMWRDRSQLGTCNETSTATITDERVTRIAATITDGSLVGIWGDAESAPRDVAVTIASSIGKPIRELVPNCGWSTASESPTLLERSIQTAILEGALLHVPVDALHNGQQQGMAERVAQCLAACDVPTLLTGAAPWRPTTLLAMRSYSEIELKPPTHADRTAAWSAAIPQANCEHLHDVAGRYRMSPDEIKAAARLAQSQSEIETNGRVVTVDETLDLACRTVTQKTSSRFVVNIKPRRNPEDLILPPELYRQVIEIAEFTRVLPTVSEEWGFGRMATGGTGLKCLFTGDPGTGKTLCAEVVAKKLGVPFLKVSIGDMVSKWIGETEKNLDATFREASACGGILFFDEADALFGKRGEVRHGTDRYANLEVGHLLQRLEDHNGLVVLASNLKDNIDPAFTRRFHVVLHLPRPVEADRRRIWQIAFPHSAPVNNDVDLALTARLDMTGAGIVNAARTAALLAANDDSPEITMAHVVHGISRQFRRESRVLTTAELGPYASVLQASP